MSTLPILPNNTLTLLDTNILIHYVRQSLLYQKIEQAYHLQTISPIPLISIVSIRELKAMALYRRWGVRRVQRLQQVLVGFPAIPVDRSDLIAAYAQIDAFSRRQGREMGKNDLWIAATATITGATLLTTDKDFNHLDPLFLSRVWIDPTL